MIRCGRPAIPGMPGMAGSHENWGNFKCHKWGELLRHLEAKGVLSILCNSLPSRRVEQGCRAFANRRAARGTTRQVMVAAAGRSVTKGRVRSTTLSCVGPAVRHPPRRTRSSFPRRDKAFSRANLPRRPQRQKNGLRDRVGVGAGKRRWYATIFSFERPRSRIHQPNVVVGLCHGRAPLRAPCPVAPVLPTPGLHARHLGVYPGRSCAFTSRQCRL